MEPTQPATPIQTKNSAKPFALSALILLPIVLIGYFFFGKKETAVPETPNTDTPVNPDTAGNTTTDSTPAPTAASYKDGVYKATGAYTSPAGPEEVPVTITLQNGNITAVTVEPMTKNEVSNKFQTGFSTNVKTIVIGKSIDEVNLDVVSGSSLTPKGFNDAIEKIKTQARS